MTEVVIEPGSIVVITDPQAPQVLEVSSPGPKGDTGPVSSVSGTAPIQVASGTSTPVISIDPATDIAHGSMSAADKTKLNAISGTNTGNETAATVGALISGATAKTTLVDADTFCVSDSAASNVLKKYTWANLKAGVFAAWGALIGTGTAKTTPVDADAFALMDSAASNATKTLTWANLKATLKTYLDTLYASSATNGMTLIGSATASSSGVIDFTSVTGYDSYLLVGENIVPGTNAVVLFLRGMVNGVPVSGAGDYSTENVRFTAAGGYAFDGAYSSGIQLSGTAEVLGNGANQTYSFRADISFSPRMDVHFRGRGLAASGAYLSNLGGGGNYSSSGFNGLRLFMSSGVIATGTFHLYGLKS